MNILHIIQSINPASGGPSAVVHDLCKLMQARKINTEIVTLDPPDAPWLATSPYTTIGLGRGLTAYGFFNTLGSWLDKNIRRFDRVMVHGLWAGHCYPAHAMCIRHKIPYFVYPHGMLDPWFKEQFPLKHLKKQLFWPWSEYPLLRDAQKVLFTCQAEMEKSYKSFRRYRANPAVVGVGVAPVVPPPHSRAIVDNAFPDLKEKSYLLFMSRLHPIKGLDNLIDAWKELSQQTDYRLVIAGPSNDAYGDTIRKKAEELRLPRILFTGMVKGEIKAALLKEADLFIQPSFLESFGMSVVESLSAGTPCLVTDNVGVYREIEEDQAGLIAQPTSDSLRACISRWSDFSHSTKTTMRRAALKCFADHFTQARNASLLFSAMEIPHE
jgi:glycosyltransferase involved in cell wall biosynthesis